MFNIGDLIVYSAHGICKIDDICDKTVSGITRTYYVLHPMDNHRQLTISTPVDHQKGTMLELLKEEEAQEILEIFKNPMLKWEVKPHLRYSAFSDIVNTGVRKDIAKVVNTLMRKKLELELQEKKLYEQDKKLLITTQTILLKELALSLNSSVEEVYEMVVRTITEHK